MTLRDYYSLLQTALRWRPNLSFWEKLTKCPYDKENAKKYSNILFNLICPHCLKTIMTEKMSFICPMCDYSYTYYQDVNKKWQALFDKCVNCHGEIKYMTCPHCQKTINLFGDYDYEGLKRARREA